MPVNAEEFMPWKGRTETMRDVVTQAPVRLMCATLDRPPGQEPQELPPLWHWLYFLPSPRQSQIGPDGHAERGGFLPPVPLPRRMWAGGQLEFIAPLRVGDEITRTSTIDDITLKGGRSGELCFVRVRHEVEGTQGLAIREFHDIVYREAAQPGAKPASHQPAPEAAVSRRVVPDDVLLFRYSALTFNGHRIHYDRRYVTEVEGYPGLIVHGPLMATLLAQLGRDMAQGRGAKTFSFRAMKPVFDLNPFDVCGAPAGEGGLDLWIRDHEGHVAMQAQMTFA